MIVSGSTSGALAAELSAALGEPLALVEYEHFPDGEFKCRIADLADASAGRAVVVASTATSDAHLELLQLQDAAREAGVGEVITVVPYLGYARQDRAFAAGDPVSARAVARAISTGTDRVLTVTPHEQSVCDFFDPPAASVDAADRLAEPLPAGLTDPVFLSPDEGAVEVAETVRDAYGAGETDYFEKTRHSGREVEVSPSDVAVDGRDVVVVDDIVATGSTMSESIGVLNDRGAARVFVGCVHPLLVDAALARLRRAGVDAVYGTDTLDRSVSVVSAAPAIAAALGAD